MCECPIYNHGSAHMPYLRDLFEFKKLYIFIFIICKQNTNIRNILKYTCLIIHNQCNEYFIVVLIYITTGFNLKLSGKKKLTTIK